MTWVEVYGGQRSLAFELTTAKQAKYLRKPAKTAEAFCSIEWISAQWIWTISAVGTLHFLSCHNNTTNTKNMQSKQTSGRHDWRRGHTYI